MFVLCLAAADSSFWSLIYSVISLDGAPSDMNKENKKGLLGAWILWEIRENKTSC